MVSMYLYIRSFKYLCIFVGLNKQFTLNIFWSSILAGTKDNFEGVATSNLVCLSVGIKPSMAQ